MGATENRDRLFTESTFILTIIERDDGKKKQALARRTAQQDLYR